MYIYSIIVGWCVIIIIIYKYLLLFIIYKYLPRIASNETVINEGPAMEVLIVFKAPI